MRKTPLILLAGVIAALILGNVIEVRFHAEKLADVPGAFAKAARDGSVYEKVRAQAVQTKRLVERLIIRDEKQRFEVALRYVEQDSDRLRRLIQREGSEQPEKLAAQAGLLDQSLTRVREQSQAVTVENLIEFKDKTQTALAMAQEVLQTSEEVKTNFENLKSRLAEVKASLESQIGKLVGEVDEAGDVAGTNTGDEETKSTATPAPEPSIPLKF